MVYHHLFVIPERLNNDYISVINLVGFDFQSILANFSKICVCIFVFCSGIGLYYSLIKTEKLSVMYKKVLIHGFKFMLNFWVILLFVTPIGISLHYFSFDFNTVFRLFTASYDGIMEWWFVKQYIVLLVAAPVFVRLFQNIELQKKIIPVVVLTVIYCSVKVVTHIDFLENSIILLLDKFFSYLGNLDCMLTFVVGMICARYNAIYVFQKYSGKNRLIVCAFSVIMAMILRVLFSNTPTSMTVDFFVVPMFVLPFTTLIYSSNTEEFFCFFAKHSTNIWLTHTFWCYYFGQSIVLLPKYSLFIYIWLIILSLLSSYVINIFYIPICNLLFSKDHKLSYKGYLYYNRRS